MPRTNQIQFLTPSRRTPGAIYHWKPSPKLRRLGWTNERLGEDWDTACGKALAKNGDVEKWLAANAAGTAPKKPLKILRWKDLVADYKAGNDWLTLKPRSRREYECHLRTLDHWALDGDLRLCDLDRPMIIDFRNTLVTDKRKHRTAAILRVLSIIVGHGVNRGWLPLGLAAKMKIPNPPKRKHRILVDHLPALLDAADELKLPHIRLGIVLGFFTTQREGDLLATTAFRFRDVADISGEARRALAGNDGRVLGLFLEQEKTDALVGIPLIPRARTEVEAAITASRCRVGEDGDRQQIISQLLVKNGRPCHQKTFQRDFARVRDFAAKAARSALQALLDGGAGEQAIHAARTLYEALAGREPVGEDGAANKSGAQFRDLRRSGMCWLRDMGVPVAMIASISGHSIDETQKILDTYMPRDTRSAAEGMAIAVTRQAERDAADKKEREGAQ